MSPTWTPAPAPRTTPRAPRAQGEGEPRGKDQIPDLWGAGVLQPYRGWAILEINYPLSNNHAGLSGLRVPQKESSLLTPSDRQLP